MLCSTSAAASAASADADDSNLHPSESSGECYLAL